MAIDAGSYLPWRISGSYLEACNCEAICPCRSIGDRKGGRSTYGTCLSDLFRGGSPRARPGRSGSPACALLALRYHDDEPGSPWSFVLYLDQRADERQSEALESIFLGRLRGTPDRQFPWVWKPSDLLGVRQAEIEVDHTPGRGWFRAGSEVTVRVREPVADQEPVTCVIPGHHQSGREVVAELLRVEDGPLEFELTGRCGYESIFDYSSEDA